MMIMKGISYRTVPRTIRLIFPEFLRAFRRVKLHKNIGNKENNCHIVQCKRSIINLLLTYKIYTICQLVIYQRGKTKNI